MPKIIVSMVKYTNRLWLSLWSETKGRSCSGSSLPVVDEMFEGAGLSGTGETFSEDEISGDYQPIMRPYSPFQE